MGCRPTRNRIRAAGRLLDFRTAASSPLDLDRGLDFGRAPPSTLLCMSTLTLAVLVLISSLSSFPTLSHLGSGACLPLPCCTRYHNGHCPPQCKKGLFCRSIRVCECFPSSSELLTLPDRAKAVESAWSGATRSPLRPLPSLLSTTPRCIALLDPHRVNLLRQCRRKGARARS